MRKQFIIALSVAFASLIICSCSSKELDKQIAPSSSIQSANYAIFSSIEEYQSLFTDPNTIEEKADKVAARFGTYNERARFEAWGIEDTLYSDFLQKILNEDYIVKIGEWLIKIDKINEKALALNEKYSNQYSDLAASDTSNKNILIYDTSEEILTLLQNGEKSNVSRTSGLFCFGRQEKYLWLKNIPTGEYIDDTQTLKMVITVYTIYNPGAIQYELKSKVFSDYIYGTSGIHPYSKAILTVGWDASWRVNCGALITKGEWNTSYNAEEVEKIHYRGYKSLSRYKIEVRGITNKKDGSLWVSPILTMADAG